MPHPGALALALAICSVVGCDNSKAGKQGSEKPATPKTVDTPPPSARSQLVLHRSLIDESARAELEIGGLFIDFGTADQHKYTRGGWRTGFGDNAQEDTVNLSKMNSRRGKLDVDLHKPVKEIVVRARGGAITMHAGNKTVGSAKLGADWSVARIPGDIEAGRHELSLSRRGGKTEIDWMWLAETAGKEPPPPFPRVLTMPIGDVPRRALVAPSARAYSFFLQPAAGQSLVFDYGSEVGATFRVRAQTDDGQVHDLFEEEGDGEWKEARVDLAAVAGKAIRLELSTDGGKQEGASGWGDPEIMTESAPAPPDDKAPGGRMPAQNVIVILIDTVRYDMFEPFAPKNPVHTPVYDELAKRSTVFVNAYNNENWTKPSVATTLSGVYPSTHDTKRDGSALPREVKLITQPLKEEEFSTAGFVANGYVSKKFGFGKGWDHFTNYIRENKSSEAEHVYADALEWLEKNKDGRFFLYIQTIDPHVIYKVEREYTRRYYAEDYSGPLGPSVDATDQVALSKKKIPADKQNVDWLRALYYGEVTYHDEHMGVFLDEVKKLGVPDNTAIIVTNDHGEELGEHGRFGHGHSLYEPMIRAPLLVHYPPMFPEGRRVDEVVEHVDLVPTLLEILGLRPMPEAEGQSLLPLLTGEPIQRPFYAVSEFLDGRRAVRVGDWKFMRSSGDWIHLHNVVEDPGEDDNRIAANPIARRMCEVYLGEALATPDKRQRQRDITTRQKFKAGKAKIGREVRRQLEALGYFGDDH